MNSETESQLLQQLLPELTAEGYEVFLHPNQRHLPRFFEGYIPDAIALGKEKNLAIEIVRASTSASKKLDRITPLFEGDDRWELRVVWLTPSNTRVSLKTQSLETIQRRVEEARELAEGGHHESSLLIVWAAFEALARVVVPDQFKRPQTPARLVQILSREGYLTPSEADLLRRLADKRNSFIHGELQIRASRSDIKRFAAVLESLLQDSIQEAEV